MSLQFSVPEVLRSYQPKNYILVLWAGFTHSNAIHGINMVPQKTEPSLLIQMQHMEKKHGPGISLMGTLLQYIIK